MDNRLIENLREPRLLFTSDRRAVPVGHRGAPRIFPENTLEAFERAVDLGAWMIELDVRQTSDGVLVVFHDEELGRMCGADGTVQSHTWDKLAKLQVEGWFRIPRLDDVLRRLRERVWVNVEVKQADPQKVADTVAKAGMSDQVVVSSFDWEVLAAVAKVDAKLQRGLLTETRGDPAAALAKHAATGWFPRADLIDAPLLAEVHGAGGYVMTWTVDDPVAIRRLADLGVDAICSNDVESLVTALS